MTRRSPTVLAALALAAAVSIQARQRPQPVATGLILGRVVDADSGRGVGDVVVTIGRPLDRPSSAQLVDIGNPPQPGGQTQRVLTAADGRFVFANLPRGRYALVTAAADYVPGEHGQARPLGPGLPIDLDEGQRLDGLTIRVWKFGVITGTVLDDLGDPAVGVTVRPLRRVIAGGRPRFAGAGTAVTDDRGIYRATSLMPGAHAVAVVVSQVTTPLSAIAAWNDASRTGARDDSEPYRSMMETATPVAGTTTGLRRGDFFVRQMGGLMTHPLAAVDGRVLSHQTTFYPSATAAAQATLVTLESGEERAGVDLQLRPQPTVRVSGTVSGPAGPGAFLGITLIPAAGSDLQSEGMAEAASAVSDASGAFSFIGVPAGQYTLKIRRYPRPGPAGRGAPPSPPPPEPTLWAIVPLTVGDRDIRDLAVVLRPGLTVSGRVEFAGTRPAPAAAQIQRMSITLQSAEGRTSAPIAAAGRATPDAAFRTAGYPAGRYIVAASALPAGWSIRSIVADGRDVSVEPLELSDADVTGVVITLTDRSTQLTGRIDDPEAAAAGVEIIAFPADSMAWRDIGVPARRGRNLRVAPEGAFVIAGLPPGDYFVVAVRSSEVTDWRDPQMLDRLIGGAARVTLADGDQKSIELRMRR